MTIYKYIAGLPHLTDEQVALVTQGIAEAHESEGHPNVTFGERIVCAHGRTVGVTVQVTTDAPLADFNAWGPDEVFDVTADGVPMAAVPDITQVASIEDIMALLAPGGLFGNPEVGVARFDANDLFR